MRVFAALSPYYNAIHAASGGQLRHWPAAARDVLKARLRYGIGPLFHALYGFRHKDEAEWGEYLRENDAVTALARLTSLATQSLLKDKLAFTLHCHRHDLPTIPILFRIDREHAPELDEVFPNGLTLTTWEAVLEHAPERIFAKLIDGSQGMGAFTATRSGNDWVFDGQRGSAADFHRFAIERLNGGRGWLFQPAITPHPSLAEIMSPGALGTVRATTYTDALGTHIVCPVLRIPARNNIVDNFSSGQKGNLIAAVDVDSGRLHRAQFSRSTTWPDIAQTDHHPDTGGRIVDRQLPFWAEAKELVIRAQRCTARPPTIGWDIAITASGPLIVEANAQYGIDIFQVAYQRGIKSMFEHILSSVGEHRSAEQTRTFSTSITAKD